MSSLTVVQVPFEQQLHSKGSSTQRRLFILNPVLSSSILLTFGETVIGRKRLLIKTSTSVNHLIPIVPLFIYLFTFLTFSPTSAEPWIASERYVNGRKICGKHTHTRKYIHHSDQGSLLTFVYSHTSTHTSHDEWHELQSIPEIC